MAGQFKRTKENLNFIRDNWENMPKKDMAEKLGCSTSLVSMIGAELGLPIQHKQKDSPCTVESIRRMRKYFRIGQKITLKVKLGRGKYTLVKGTVIDKTDCLVAVKKEIGIESFKYAEFRAGEVKVVGV